MSAARTTTVDGTPLDALERAAVELTPISLEETIADAALQTRVDRKYVLPPSMLHVVIDALGDECRVLDIDGVRCAAYESVYFDTPDLESFRGASTRRRRRWKVRTRTYLDSHTAALEVKTRGDRGETVKTRMPYAVGDRALLTPSGLAFVTEHVMLPHGGRELAPVLDTRYRRTTLVAPDAGLRLTIDADLRCRSADGATLVLPDHVVVETKSAGPPTAPDRALWCAGARPMAISKFGIGMAGTRPELAANRWARPLRRWFVLDTGRR